MVLFLTTNKRRKPFRRPPAFVTTPPDGKRLLVTVNALVKFPNCTHIDKKSGGFLGREKISQMLCMLIGHHRERSSRWSNESATNGYVKRKRRGLVVTMAINEGTATTRSADTHSLKDTVQYSAGEILLEPKLPIYPLKCRPPIDIKDIQLQVTGRR